MSEVHPGREGSGWQPRELGADADSGLGVGQPEAEQEPFGKVRSSTKPGVEESLTQTSKCPAGIRQLLRSAALGGGWGRGLGPRRVISPGAGITNHGVPNARLPGPSRCARDPRVCLRSGGKETNRPSLPGGSLAAERAPREMLPQGDNVEMTEGKAQEGAG